MLYTFNRFHHVSKFCNFPGLTSHGNNLKAVVMIKMDVLGRNNYTFENRAEDR